MGLGSLIGLFKKDSTMSGDPSIRSGNGMSLAVFKKTKSAASEVAGFSDASNHPPKKKLFGLKNGGPNQKSPDIDSSLDFPGLPASRNPWGSSDSARKNNIGTLKDSTDLPDATFLSCPSPSPSSRSSLCSTAGSLLDSSSSGSSASSKKKKYKQFHPDYNEDTHIFMPGQKGFEEIKKKAADHYHEIAKAKGKRTGLIMKDVLFIAKLPSTKPGWTNIVILLEGNDDFGLRHIATEKRIKQFADAGLIKPSTDKAESKLEIQNILKDTIQNNLDGAAMEIDPETDLISQKLKSNQNTSQKGSTTVHIATSFDQTPKSKQEKTYYSNITTTFPKTKKRIAMDIDDLLKD